MEKDEDNHYLTLRSAGSKVRSIANLLIGYNHEVGVPLNLRMWLELGEILDDLGQDIVKVADELEMEVLAHSPQKAKRRT